jgi:phenylalanyl-tRNA synthetase beta chain
MISEDLFEGPTNDAVEIKNPLSEDMTYLRKTLIPSLLEVARMNKGREELKIFEIANIYEKKVGDLPKERRMIAGVIKKQNASFFEAKGIAEQLFKDLGLKKIMFKNSEYGGVGSSVYIDESYLGEVELLESNLVNFEFNLEKIIKNASLNKKYKKLAKYPPVIEDLAIIAKEETRTAELIDEIYMQSDLVKEVNLLDQYKNTRTFHIIYQSDEKNLTIEETSKIREKILSSLKKKFEARLKE